MIKDILENISSFKIYLPKIVGTDISNAILNFPSCAAYVAYSVGCAAYSVTMQLCCWMCSLCAPEYS